VFVSVKGPKSKRKVAVPISDETDWQSFVDTVRLKLKLSGVGDMYLASTGELVQSLDQLQDIDEVHVIEVRDVLGCSISDMEWKNLTKKYVESSALCLRYIIKTFLFHFRRKVHPLGQRLWMGRDNKLGHRMLRLLQIWLQS